MSPGRESMPPCRLSSEHEQQGDTIVGLVVSEDNESNTESQLLSSFEKRAHNKHRREKTWGGGKALDHLDAVVDKTGQKSASFYLKPDRSTEASKASKALFADVALRVCAMNRVRQSSSSSRISSHESRKSMSSQSSGANVGEYDPAEPGTESIDAARKHSPKVKFSSLGTAAAALMGAAIETTTPFDSVIASLPLDEIAEDGVDSGVAPRDSPFDKVPASPMPKDLNRVSSTEHLFRNAEKVDKLFQVCREASLRQQKKEVETELDTNDRRNDHTDVGFGSDDLTGVAKEMEPLTDANSNTSGARNKESSSCENSPSWAVAFSNRFLPKSMRGWVSRSPGSKSNINGYGSILKSEHPRRSLKSVSRIKRHEALQSLHQSTRDALHPRVLLQRELNFISTTGVIVILPSLVASAILYYAMGNPQLSFLPTDASLSWCLVFVARQCLTLHMAWTSEYILCEVLALRSTLYPVIFGPLVTLFVIQSKGWPFVITVWGLLDIILVMPSHALSRHWLYFLNIGMFSDENPGGGVLESEIYFRLLLSLIFVGVATSMKRTNVALYLGKRTFVHYKPELERIVADIRLLAEIADLGAETDSPDFKNLLSLAKQFVPTPRESDAYNIKFQDIQASNDDISIGSESDGARGDGNSSSASGNDGLNPDDALEINQLPDVSRVTPQASPVYSFDSKRDLGEENDTDNRKRAYINRRMSSDMKMKNLLDSWEEPVNKANKASDPSIHNILQFRKAISYMEDTHPFSLSFGPADTRDHCLRSSMRLYRRLLRYTPWNGNLEFDVIGALAYDISGNLDEQKRKALGRLLRPDANDEISMTAFVQSCDANYKRLRYFLASVGNSIIIDMVLEQIVNAIFYVILFMLILSFLRFDPWRLLVSLSTLTVSFAFAFGPSTAKYIDGILLIAVRRPYDLGDRISFSSADAKNPSMGETWFVDDITLSSTTLRYAATNEVATINNASIANSRIFNGTRSPRSLVTILLPFSILATHEQMDEFRSSVEAFLKDRPRTWHKLVHFRSDTVDNAAGMVEYSLRVQHRKSWQEQAAILNCKGELLGFCHEVAEKLGILYVQRPRDLNVCFLDSQKKTVLDGGGIADAFVAGTSTKKVSDKKGFLAQTTGVQAIDKKVVSPTCSTGVMNRSAFE